ncbi:pyroglutamylated RF-amide peptide receptor-like [Haliotis rufescens]|uniref:pyroglutamylated RF-amide peptide receptor-like n=1 Tax=Haliotis rufescens TaxID=6454 RepID=UPI00201EBE1E|nr:pyroglutamylated RF-amide peptide receptor-like [Haliotis rufescens]
MQDNCPETTSFIRVHPSIVFFCVLLVVVGIPGNCLILFIYTKKINIHIISFFTKTQAFLNLVSTLCLLPALVLFKMNVEEAFFSKWFSVGQHFFVFNTGLFYVTIAVQRYKKMCKDQQSQINASLAKKILLGCVLISVLSCTPHALLIDVNYTVVNATNGITTSYSLINITYIDFTEYAKTYHLATIYVSWLLLELTAIVVSLTVLYSLIGKHIAAHKRQMSRYSVSGQGHTKLSNPTAMFFTLTMIFLLSVAPRMGLAIFVQQSINHSHYSQSVHHVRDVILMLPFINCIVNPFVYGFTSKVFRQHLVSLFCACNGRKESTPPPSQTERTQESVL